MRAALEPPQAQRSQAAAASGNVIALATRRRAR
jgi:hypothetical protein